MNLFREELIKVLEKNNWEEPTKEKYLTMSLKNVARRTHRLGYLKTTIWYEDIHYVWCNYKPETK